MDFLHRNSVGTQSGMVVVMDIETVALNPRDAKGALDALTGRIVCIGLRLDSGTQITEVAISDEDEGAILRGFWSLIAPNDLLVGHNILGFDIPFVQQRSWIHGIRPSREFDLRRYYTCDIVDTMQLWTNWGYRKGVALDALAQALGVGEKTGRGTDVAEWWASRDIQSINRYCLEDARLTYRVFCRLTYFAPPIT
jgi:3'-5' exonuclease